MLDRKDFLRATGAVFLGLAGLVNIDASPLLNSYRNNKPVDIKNYPGDLRGLRVEINYTRDTMIINYEEWKAEKESPDSPKNAKETKALIKSKILLLSKSRLILKHPERAYGFLTEEEKELYELEIKMMNPLIDRVEINKKYNLNLSIQEFQNNEGARILWFLERYHDYRYCEELDKTEKEKPPRH